MIRGFAVRMALRDLTNAGRRLSLFVLSISVGVAAIVAVGGFRSNLMTGLRDQGRVLLGADLELQSRFPFPDEVLAVLDSVAGDQGDWAEATTVPTMVSAEATGRSTLLALRALESVYPFYGSVETVPPGAWSGLEARSGGGGVARVLVESGVLTRLGVAVGDTLRIGELRAVVEGEVTSVPGNPGIRASLNPRVYLAAGDLPATELIRTGSLATYRAYVRVADRRDAFRFGRRYRPLLTRHSISWETAADRERDVSRAFDTVGRFLGLVGLAALLLGAVGVASAMHVYVRQRQKSAALLRCLGATGSTLVRIHIIQAVVLAALGSVLGVVFGLGLQAALPRVLGDVLPVGFDYRLDFLSVATGVLAGVWTATLFAWHAIAPIEHTPALGAIRRAAIGGERVAATRTIKVIRVLIAATVIGLCMWQAGAVGEGLVFAAGIGTALLALAGIASLLIKITRRATLAGAPLAGAPFWVRQGVANLFRPQNQTRAAVMAVGFGVFLIGTVASIDRNVRTQFSLAGSGIEANLAVFDVPADRTATLLGVMNERGYPALEVLPLMPARLHAVEGALVADLLEASGRRGRRGASREATDENPPPAAWALRREYRNSVRDTLVAGESVVAGTWWDETDARSPTPDGLIRVSLEVDVARALRVGVGDTITWDFQGRTVDSEVASLREVDWSRLAPNFLGLFEPGTADRIPRTDLVLTRIDDAVQRAEFQNLIVTTAPGALVIDLASVQAVIETVLDRAAIATRFMGGFTLAAGLLILAAIVIAARGLRLRENALLRALGADSKTLRGILTAEFFTLGALAGLAGVSLAAVASWALVRGVFDLPFSLPFQVLVSLWAGAILLTLVLGAMGSRAVARPPALAAIRQAEAIG